MGSARGAPRGSLLIITLWLVTILSLVAIALGRYLALDVRMARYRQAREQARVLARSAVDMAIWRLGRDETAADWAGDAWAGAWEASNQTGGIARIVKVEDAERKLDINRATREQLERITGDASLAEAVSDYVDAEPRGRAVDGEPPYYPKNGPVGAIEELLDIPEMSAEGFAMLERATVALPAAEPPKLNINTATAEALLAVAGPTLGGEPSETIVERLVAGRNGPNGEPGDDDDCYAETLESAAATLAACALSGNEAPLVELLSRGDFTTRSEYFTVVAEGRLERPPVTYTITAVVQRPQPTQAPLMVSWHES